MAPMFVDKEVKFDVTLSYARLKPGEKVIDRLESIEDTKGNGGIIGQLIITNLRIIWHSLSNPNVSLSIGYNCIISTSTTNVNSSLRGKTQALHILTTFNHTKFEFIFTNLISGNYRHFTSVMGVHKAYVLSKLYRELRLRGSVVQNGQLKILPQEQVFSTVIGVWNLSSDQGNLGTLITTNVRIVWFADINECFNISLPYLQISTVKIQESKFGLALIIISHESSGGFVLGFRLSTQEKLQSIFKEIATLNRVYSNSPIFGVEYTLKQSENISHDLSFNEIEDTVKETPGEITNLLTVYLVDGTKDGENEPFYYSDLGLSIEKLKDSYTPNKLWEVIPAS